MPKDYGIIGAGPSGLAVALFLKGTFDVLEKEKNVGGHAASFSERGFTFDYGPHILFSKDKQILDFIVATLGENVYQCRRNNKISFKGNIVKYPFENDLSSLPLEDNYACISQFLFNQYQEIYKNPSNMREWFLKTFGEGICSRYLFPYNEKVWNIPVEKLAMSLAERIPNPPVDDILKSSLGYSTEGYLHQLYYFYPKVGGYQAICEAWRKNTPVNFKCEVEEISIEKEGIFKIKNSRGEIKSYKKLISTMPIHDLVKKLKINIPSTIQEAISRLIVNPMFVVSFGIKGVDPNKYTAVYFPESDFWVNRISYPCTFSPENGPKGHWSLQAEVTCSPNSPILSKTDQEMIEHVYKGLNQRGLIPDRSQIVYQKVNRIEKSYVVYDVGYEENSKKVRDWFESKGIFLLGRFSYFEYINVDKALERAIFLAKKLNNEELDDGELKTQYLSKALKYLTDTKSREEFLIE